MFKREKEKGAILIITLWILAILTVMAAGFGYRMVLELKLVGYQLGRLKVLYLAKAGVRRAVLELGRDKNNYDALREPWSDNEEAFREIKLGEGKFTVSYPFPEDDEEKTVIVYGMIDEERKVNINKASRETLESLLELTDEPLSFDISASIVDWRDKDSRPEEGGAEDPYYQSLEKPYNCKNSDFEGIEELLLVKGMTPQTLSRIQDMITIYGDGKININTAGKRVLQALGQSAVRTQKIPGADENTADELAEKIIRFRRQGEGEKDNEEYVFKNLNEIVNKLRGFEGGEIGSGEKNLINTLKPQLTVRSNNFKIRTIASLDDDKVVKSVTAIVERKSDKSITMKYWHED